MRTTPLPLLLAAGLLALCGCSRPAATTPAAKHIETPTVVEASEIRARLATRAPEQVDEAAPIAAPLNAFAAWCASWSAAAPDQQAALVARGVVIATERREAMKTLIRLDPELAIRLSIATGDRAALPPAVADLLERTVAATADYDVAIACALPHEDEAISHDHGDEITRTLHLDGTPHQAFVYGRRLDVSSKNALPVHGVAIDDLVAVAESPIRRLPAASGSPTVPYLLGDELHEAESAEALDALEEDLAAAELEAGPKGTAAATPWTEGDKTMLYIRVTFSDEPDAEPLPLSQAETYQGNVALFYRQNSYGKATITTTFTPTLVLPNPASYYNSSSWTTLLSHARSAARDAGYSTSNYNLYVVAARRLSSFSYAGQAYVGAAGAHLNGDFALRCVAHELGHNFGLYHANYNYVAGESPISREAYPAAPKRSPDQDYGHRYNMMGTLGYTTAFHFSAREKVFLDWIPEEDNPVVLQSGVHRLQRNDHIDATGLRSLRVPSGDAARPHFWLAYRRNYASGSYTTPYFSAGAEVVWGRSVNGSNGTLLIDTTPFSDDGPHSDTSSADNDDKVDAALTVGRMFGNADAGAWFTILGQGGNSPDEYLDVAVEVGNFSRNRPPEVTISAPTATLSTGQTFSLAAVASDPDGDPVTLSWDFGDGDFAGDLSTVSKSWSSSGHQVVRVVAVDRKGGQASARCVVRVGSPSTHTVSGRVLANGEPVEGVRVFNGRTGSSYRGTRTDSQGYYTIPNVSSGSYTLQARKDGYVFAAGFTNPASVSASVDGRDFDATTAPLPRIIVDNADATGVEITAGSGSWLPLNSAAGFYAGDYITDNNSYKGQKQILYRPDLPATGLYRVYARHAASSNRATNVPIDIAYQDGQTTVTVDQTVNGGVWNYLGTYVFAAGTEGYARVRTDGTDGHVCADAFMFEAVDEVLPSVRLVTLRASAEEQGLVPARVRIEREGGIDDPLTVYLATHAPDENAALPGVDFVAPPESVTFPAGTSALELEVTPITDSVIEGDKSFVLALRQPDGPVQDWSFDDAAGATIDQTVNSVEGGAAWTLAIADSFTTGTGALRLRRASPGNATSWAPLPAAPTATQYLVLETAGWQYTGTDANEEVRIGFMTAAGSHNSVAQAIIARTADGIFISGEAGGTGGTPVAATLMTTDTTTDDTYSVVVALDPVAGAYRVYYRNGMEGAYTHVGSGSVAPGRVAGAIRLHTLYSFASTSAERFDIGRIRLTDADPTQPAYLLMAPSEAELMVKDNPRDAWRFSQFNGGGLDDPAVTAWTADPDGDGLDNLAEYAFGRSPNVPDADGLTPVSLVEFGGERHLSISFRRRIGDTWLTYVPEASSELTGGAWPDAALAVGSPVPAEVDADYEDVTYRDPVPLNEAPRRFLRVRVETDAE